MQTFLWIAGGLCSGLGVLFTLLNWGCIWARVRDRRRGIDKNHSLVPLVGPVFVMMGANVAPMEIPWWLWLSWAVDPGTYVLICVLPYVAYDIYTSKREP